MKAIVSTFNQAQKGAFSVIVKHQTLRRYVSSSSGNCCCVQVLHFLLHLPRSVRAAVPDVPLLLHLAQVHRRHGGDEVEAPGLYYLLTILSTHYLLTIYSHSPSTHYLLTIYSLYVDIYSRSTWVSASAS